MNKNFTINVPPFPIYLHQTREQLSAYLPYKNPPDLNQVFHDIGSKELDEIDIGLNYSIELSDGGTG